MKHGCTVIVCPAKVGEGVVTTPEVFTVMNEEVLTPVNVYCNPDPEPPVLVLSTDNTSPTV